MAELWRSIGFTSGARIYGVLAGSVSLIISARMLGPEGRGDVAAAVTWALLFATIGYLSLGQVAIHRAAGRPVADWLGTTLAALFVMTGAVSVVAWIVAGGMYAATGGEAFGGAPGYAIALGFAALPFLVWEQYGSQLLSAVDRISVYNRAEMAGRTIGVLGVVVLVGIAQFGVAGALVALLAAQFVVAAAGWRSLVRLAGPRLEYDAGTLRSMIGSGLQLHLNAVGTFLFTNATVLIVNALRGSSETGAFQAVVQLMMVGQLVPQAASLVLYGTVAREGPDRAWPANRRILLGMTGLMTLAAGIGWLLAPTLVPLLFGDEFEAAVPVFRILVFGLIGNTFSALMAPQWIGRGLFWQASALTLTLGICNVVASFVLVDAHGMKGAAYALLGVSFCSVVFNGAMAVWVQRKVVRTA
jgi:O-antigen/teichoic acid export membrane protein